MKKNYQTPEYRSVPRPGTLVMRERRHFFGSKMMEIEDVVRVSSLQQTDFTYRLKRLCVDGPTLDQDQTNEETQSKASWTMVVDTPRLLREYLYQQLTVENEHDDFTSLEESKLSTGKRSDSVLDYIETNLVDRYTMRRIVMWVSYYELSNVGPLTNGRPEKLLKYTPLYHPAARPTDADLDPAGLKTASELDAARDALAAPVQVRELPDGKHRITFKQEKAARFFTFAFDLDVVLEKV